MHQRHFTFPTATRQFAASWCGGGGVVMVGRLMPLDYQIVGCVLLSRWFVVAAVSSPPPRRW